MNYEDMNVEIFYDEDFEVESRIVEFGMSGVTYFTMEDIIDLDVPQADFDSKIDLPF
jgi:hypothetical protein